MPEWKPWLTLFVFMVADVSLDAVSADMRGEPDHGKFNAGILKSFAVAAAVGALWTLAYWIPDLITFYLEDRIYDTRAIADVLLFLVMFKYIKDAVWKAYILWGTPVPGAEDRDEGEDLHP